MRVWARTASERGIKPYYSLECWVNSRIHSLGSVNASLWIFIKESEQTSLKRDESMSRRDIACLSENTVFSSRSWIKFLECICSWEPLPSERIWEDFWWQTCEGVAKGIRERASVWRDMKALCQVTFPPRHYNTLKLHVNAWSLSGENSHPAARVSCSLPAYAQPTWILTWRFDSLHSQISFLHQDPFKL